MGERSITFINNDFYFKPNSSIQSYYQICLYKDKYKNMYGIRKIFFNEKMEIVDVRVRHYPKKILDKFIEKNKLTKENKIRLYPYSDINSVPYPTMSDMNESFSGLLNGATNIIGYSDPKF